MPAHAINRWFVIVLLGTSLTACGFRLAGSGSLPQSLSSIRLQTVNFNDQQRGALVKSLKRAGARVGGDSNDTAALLNISIKVIPERTLASSANSGGTLVQIARELSYSLKSASGDVLMKRQVLLRRKDIQLDSDRLLSSVAEQESAAQNLEQALFDQLIQQLKSL